MLQQALVLGGDPVAFTQAIDGSGRCCISLRPQHGPIRQSSWGFRVNVFSCVDWLITMLGDIQIKRFFVAGSGRGLKKGQSGVAGGRGPHSQRMTSYQPPPPQQQAPVAHRFQVTASDSSGQRG